jgi:pimeloyl-ACP methyl ester carboxylesterase
MKPDHGSISYGRRGFLATVAAAGALGAAPAPTRASPPDYDTRRKRKSTHPDSAGSAALRPFRAAVSDEHIADLRRRIAATRWPPGETVGDRSQGVRLAKVQALVRYWGGGYDWRRAEAKVNALPQTITTIDGLDIHLIHVRSRHPDALPLVMTHGWPGSVLELLKVVGPLTDPTAHGGDARDAFDLVLPSMPGYGFSGKPQATGWGPDRIAHAWAELMRRLGYRRYVAQGGDWGSVVSDAMARLALPGLAGIHVNMPATVPAEVARSLKCGDPAPASLSAREKEAYAQLARLYEQGSGYATMMATRPQTIAYALEDSPAGLAAWFYDKFADWTDSGGEPEKSLSRDDMLDDISLYWFTGTATTSARLYWENANNNFNADAQHTREIALPVAITVFPGEIYRAPRSWAERAYRNLAYFKEVDRGGHFAAWEAPQLFSSELRAAFRTLRQ